MDWIYIILLAIGSFFLFTATVGLFVMPDVFGRLHATTKCDTVAAGCILAAVAIRAADWFVIAKLALIFMFVLLVNPTVAHVIAWVAKRDTDKAQERECS